MAKVSGCKKFQNPCRAWFVKSRAAIAFRQQAGSDILPP
jgi:hypothetical protein